MLKQLSQLAGALVLSLGMASQTFAADSDSHTKAIKLEVSNEKQQQVTIEVPYMPQRIAALNFTTVDILDQLGLGDRIVGIVKSSVVPAHLKKYAEDKNIVNLGGMKDLDLEALMSLQPEVIFSSDRTVREYKTLSMIAPTVAAYVDYKQGFFAGYKLNLERHAKIFGKEAEAEKILADYQSRIERMKQQASGKNAILGLFTGGSLKILGDKGRMSVITHDIGFANMANEVNVNHGNTSSYELLVKRNPDYLFVLDKDVAVGQSSKSANQLLDNELVKQMDAHKNGRIVFLQPGDTWYLTDGGIASLDLMLKNIEQAL